MLESSDRKLGVWQTFRRQTYRYLMNLPNLSSMNRALSRSFARLRAVCLGRNRTSSFNVLLSLPACLFHCIFSEWVEALSVMRLEIALRRKSSHRKQILKLLKSDHFFLKKVSAENENAPWGSPEEYPYSRMLNWLIKCQVKAIEMKMHGRCSHNILEIYLQMFGKHVRHIDYYDLEYGCSYSISQSSLIERYCCHLTAYSVRKSEAFDPDILRILNNNHSSLQEVHIHGGFLDKRYNLDSLLSQPRLKNMKLYSKYGFCEWLLPLVRAAPHLERLELSCFWHKCYSICGDLILGAVRVCPQLRSFGCRELHLGYCDDALKPLLAICKDIVDLNLSMHCELTDEKLIAALGELNNLYSLNLEGCCKLTDRTLEFLGQRFASTLKLLHLDHRCFDRGA